MVQPSLLFVQGLVDGKPFKVSAMIFNDISELLGVSNEGEVTYFENVASDMFQKYIPHAELNGKVLKLWLRCKNPVNYKDLAPLTFHFG